MERIDRSNDSSFLKSNDWQTFIFEINKECNEAKFALFKDGLSVMNLISFEERVNKIESRKISQ